MKNAAAHAYRARFQKVLEYIEANPDDNLTINTLSGIAAFSRFHFHRQFSLLFGIRAFEYVQLVRLKRASYQLAFRDDDKIITIALGCGYESHEAFSRAFKQTVGQTPSAFREQPDWDQWQVTFQRLKEVRNVHMKPAQEPRDVSIIDFQPVRVAVLEHRGPPSQIGDSIRSFIAWRKQNNLPPSVSATFNILYDDPNETAPDAFRLDLCAGINRSVAENTFGVTEKLIPKGRCAVLRHVGSDDSLGDAIRYLYATWLPASGEEPRDFPLFLQRLRFFPDVPEHEAVVDIFLPIR